jgi:hypothetical protein
VTYLIKNTVDPERSRQQSTFGSADIMNGFTADVAKATKLRITPGTVKVSSAVNDGGMGGSAGGLGAMPGQMAGGQILGGAALPGQGLMTAPGNGMMIGGPQGGVAGVAAAPAPPTKKSSANGSTAGVLTVAAVLLAAVVVF